MKKEQVRRRSLAIAIWREEVASVIFYDFQSIPDYQCLTLRTIMCY